MKTTAKTKSKAVVPEDIGVPVSVKIRERIKKAKKRYHANDNISEFLQPGDLEKILEYLDKKFSLNKLYDKNNNFIKNMF